MIKYKNVKTIDLNDWDKLVEETYRRPYSFQQQDGCKDRGAFHLSIPSTYTSDDEMNDSIPEVINNETEMGVKFIVWLTRDPKAPLNPTDEELKACNYWFGEDRESWTTSKSHIDMFYERNFYPDIQMVANDLHAKGLIEAGDYVINIDW